MPRLPATLRGRQNARPKSHPRVGISRSHVTLAFAVICLPVLLLLSGADAAWIVGILAGQVTLLRVIQRFRVHAPTTCSRCAEFLAAGDGVETNDAEAAVANKVAVVVAEDDDSDEMGGVNPAPSELTRLARRLNANNPDEMAKLLDLLKELRI